MATWTHTMGRLTGPIKAALPSPLRAALRQARERLSAQLAQAAGVLPDFLIVGAQKAGTTSLYRYLAGHPHVFAAMRKEIGFFNNRFEHTLSWYRGHFPTVFRKCHQKWFHRRPFCTGEADPAYILDPFALAAIRDTLPEVKLVLLLRNPVDRAYSHYQHTRRLGVEPLDFEQALEKEDQRIGDQWSRMMAGRPYEGMPIYHFGYRHTSLYGDQVKRLLELFDRKRILVLKTEAFRADPQGQFDRVLDFLGLEGFRLEVFPRHNKGSYRPLDEQTRRRLADLFAPQQETLRKLLGEEFTWEK